MFGMLGIESPYKKYCIDNGEGDPCDEGCKQR